MNEPWSMIWVPCQERPAEADFAYYLAAHVRLCKRQEDADHWVEGYRKAGFEV